MVGLSLGALGVVFGDIGTSPLYAFSTIFSDAGYHLTINSTNIFGIVSLIIWSLMLVVSIKYIIFIMRADNAGEGGIMALIAQVKSSRLRDTYKWGFIILGLVGVSLFYGDSTITPAISVLAAVEGLKIIAPELSTFIVPATVVIIIMLFALQRYGTGVIGRLFGPVMLMWFAIIALGGVWQVIQHPSILIALSPMTAIGFFIQQPLLAFVSMGAVILAITGAEALFADMGHFGRPPIARAWFFVVLPALVLCYMGEGALLLHNSAAIANPFVLLYPDTLRIPVVMLATIATIIASQAVISGAFSLTRQAMQLDFLPRMLVRHTSSRIGGQIYLPFVNAILLVIVLSFVMIFGSSARLANAFGIAVSGTLAVDTILFLLIMRIEWQRSLRNVILWSLLFVPIDLLFIGSNLPKILKGGWLPILLGAIVFILIDVWRKGQKIIVRERRALEGSLEDFISQIHARKPPILRIPGTAVYIGHHSDLTPMALRATVDDLHELHDKVVIVSSEISTAAHIAKSKRATIDELGDGIFHIHLSYGFHDSINIPEALRYVRHHNKKLDFDVENASYFISQSKVVLTNRHNILRWHKYIYGLMDRNALSRSDYYKLPVDRTVEMRSLIRL